jgi:hypothetical protein
VYRSWPARPCALHRVARAAWSKEGARLDGCRRSRHADDYALEDNCPEGTWMERLEALAKKGKRKD